MTARLILAVLVIPAVGAQAAEVCLDDGEWICCHALCDVFSPILPTGFSTEGLPACVGGSPFRLSFSDTDPYANVGPLGFPPLVYLWVDADAGYGFSWGSGHLSGDLDPWSFVPLDPGVFWNPLTGEFTVGGCLYEPMPRASFWVLEATAAAPGPEAESWARIKSRWRETRP